MNIKQSPPPEPTPSPPPQPPPPAARQSSSVTNHDNHNFRRTSEADPTPGVAANHTAFSAPSPSQASNSQSFVQHHVQQYPSHSASPATTHSQQYGQQNTSSYSQASHTNIGSSHHSSHHDHYSTPQGRYAPHQSSHRSSALPGTVNNPSRPVEVYHLSDTANASIPEDIREQFQRDEQGRVLFFTAPPLDVLPPTKPGGAIGHTARYLAAKLRKKVALKEKQRAAGSAEADGEPAPKKPKLETKDNSFTTQVNEMKNRALGLLVAQMEQGTEAIYKDIYGEHWVEGMRIEGEKVVKGQKERMQQLQDLANSEAKRAEKLKVSLTGNGVYLDDLDPRY